MAIPTALLVKGLAGVGAVAAVVGGGILINNSLKSKDPNKTIKALGITDKSCHFEDTKDKAECELVEAKVKSINFTNKTGSDLTVSGLSGDKKLKLVIEKDYDTTDFPEGLRFTITNTDTTTEVVIGTDPNKITLKPGVSYDFKIKDDTKLEKAWTLETLAAKVGLTCTNGDSTPDCTLKTKGINVWKGNGDYITEAAQTDKTKKMTVAKDTKGHNGGFKFTVSEDVTINQSDNSKKAGTVDKLTQTNKSYEIDVKDIDGTKTWFLVEKDTTTAT